MPSRRPALPPVPPAQPGRGIVAGEAPPAKAKGQQPRRGTEAVLEVPGSLISDQQALGIASDWLVPRLVEDFVRELIRKREAV
jgi:hypothetical protein